MMDGDWVIEGSRPPSVIDNRPRTLPFRHGAYRTTSRQSSVDETLFTSHHPDPRSSPLHFTPPWVPPKKFSTQKITKVKGKATSPLFWCPTPGTSCENFQILKRGDGIRSEKFKPLRHSQTFCDDALFGAGRMNGIGFPMPWDVNAKSSAIYQDLNGNAVNSLNNNNNNNNNNANSKNWSKLKIKQSKRPKSAPASKELLESRPLWRP